MKAMIVQPMAGKSEEEIKATREKATKLLKERGFEVVNTLFSEKMEKGKETKNIPLFYLSKSLEKMAECDAVYCCAGWERARGCRIEHATAKTYGLSVIDENIERHTHKIFIEKMIF